MNTKTIVYIVVALIVVVILVLFFSQKSAAPTTPGTTAGSGLGADIYNQVAPNAAENLPETNPFNAETNPFKAVETNPFAQ